jgi:hypothetical protein
MITSTSAASNHQPTHAMPRHATPQCHAVRHAVTHMLRGDWFMSEKGVHEATQDRIFMGEVSTWVAPGGWASSQAMSRKDCSMGPIHSRRPLYRNRHCRSMRPELVWMKMPG